MGFSNAVFFTRHHSIFFAAQKSLFDCNASFHHSIFCIFLQEKIIFSFSFLEIAVARHSRFFVGHYFKRKCSQWDSCTESLSLVVMRVHLRILQRQHDMCPVRQLCMFCWCKTTSHLFTGLRTYHIQHVFLNIKSMS